MAGAHFVWAKNVRPTSSPFCLLKSPKQTFPIGEILLEITVIFQNNGPISTKSHIGGKKVQTDRQTDIKPLEITHFFYLREKK